MKFLRLATGVFLIAALSGVSTPPSEARPSRTSDYDGAWHLTFATQAGPCDAAYEFDVDISNGEITEPNLVRFHGQVAPGGVVRASVTVQNKSASGSGRLSRADGRGTWTGRSGGASCSGYWTAQKG